MTILWGLMFAHCLLVVSITAIERRALAAAVAEQYTKIETEKIISRSLLLVLESLPIVIKAPVLPVALGPGSDGAEIAFLHNGIPPFQIGTPPLLIIRQHLLRTENIALFAPVPRPWAILVIMERRLNQRQQDKGRRAELFHILHNLRSSPLWSADAWVLVTLPTAAYAASAHRAFARAGALRALAITLVQSLISPSIFVHTATLVTLRPGRRPERVPNFTNLPTHLRLTQRLDISGHSVVFSVYTPDEEYENQCLNGTFTWSFRYMDQVAGLFIKHYKIRAMCWTVNNVYGGYRQKNGSYTGLVSKIASGTADILTYNAGGATDWFKNFDELYPHLFSHVCFYVRRAQSEPFLVSLINTLSEAGWGLLVSLIAIWITMILAGLRDITTAAFRTVTTFVTGAYKTRGFSVVLALSVMTSFFGIIMLSALQSKATSYLSVPRHEPEVKTFDDVNAKVSRLYGFASAKKLMSQADHKAFSHLRRKLLIKENITVMRKGATRVVKHGDAAMILPDSAEEYYLWYKPLTTNGYPVLRQVEQCLITMNPVIFVAKKHSPYTTLYNEVIQRSIDTGIMQYLRRFSLSTRKRYNLIEVIQGPMELRPYSLRFFHIQEAFYVGGVGIIISVMIFIIENICVLLFGNPNTSRYSL